MQLENQVCSLELAKRLKELGVKQESLFRWERPTSGGWQVVYAPQAREHVYAAFTVAELGEMLPRLSLSMSVAEGSYPKWVATSKHDIEEHSEWGWEGHHRADTEADARAKMLIYLLENKLVSV